MQFLIRREVVKPSVDGLPGAGDDAGRVGDIDSVFLQSALDTCFGYGATEGAQLELREIWSTRKDSTTILLIWTGRIIQQQQVILAD